jgi:hypothetical protein
MPTKLTRLLMAAILLVVAAALTAPATALAKGKPKKHPSAVDVYVEQVQTAGGHKSAPSGHTAGTGGGTGSSTPSSTGSTSPPAPSASLSHHAKQKLHSQGGKDTGLLTEVASQAGNERRLAAVGSVSQPGTLNAAFDLGAGPTLLFALVLGTGLFVALGGGLRGYRRRRRPHS